MNYCIHRFTEVVVQSMTNSPNFIYVRNLLVFSSNRVRKGLKWKLKTGRWSSETKLLNKFEDFNLIKHVQSMTTSHFELPRMSTNLFSLSLLYLHVVKHDRSRQQFNLFWDVNKNLGDKVSLTKTLPVKLCSDLFEKVFSMRLL